MAGFERLAFDEISYWSELKLDILREYGNAYSKIFSAPRQQGLHPIYVDAFAGSGSHISKTTGDIVQGSPLIALKYAFDEYHFIELKSAKAGALLEQVKGRENVYIYNRDCNEILEQEVFPRITRQQRRRGLCLLDPYGLHLNWSAIKAAGHLGTIDIFLNFPVMDMQRNVFWRNPEGVDPHDIERMNAYWGDASWRKVAYKEVLTLFGSAEEKASNYEIACAFRNRLRELAGFDEVPKPLPMHGPTGAIVYYLFFASQKRVASKIAEAIFRKYRNQGA